MHLFIILRSTLGTMNTVTVNTESLWIQSACRKYVGYCAGFGRL